MKRIQKTLLVLSLLALTAALSACQSTKLENYIPRDQVQSVSISYLTGVGEDIPVVDLQASAAEYKTLLDLLYGADSVTLDTSQAGGSYSPELSASHCIYLQLGEGPLTLYFDAFQGIFSVPFNRAQKLDGETVKVRTYVPFQPKSSGAGGGLSTLLTSLEPVGGGEPTPSASPSPEATPAPTGFTPPDDSALRQSVQDADVVQVGTELTFEPGNYTRQGEAPLYYAFGSHETELPDAKVLVVAAGAADQTVTIQSIMENEKYIVVAVNAAAPAEGGQAEPVAAALVDRILIDKGKPVVFRGQDGAILYVQQLSIPGDIPDPNAAPDPDAPEPDEPDPNGEG